MGTVLVFVPNSIVIQDPGYLFGFLKEDSKTHSKSVYVLGTQPFENQTDISGNINRQIVGTYCTKSGKALKGKHIKHNQQNVWLTVKCINHDIILLNCFIEKELIPLSTCIVIMYDINTLIKSELFLCPDFNNKNEIDHFKILANNLQIKENDRTFKFCDSFINCLLTVFTIIHFLFERGSFIFEYSTLFSHLKNYTYSILWVGKLFKEKKFINLKIGNYLMSTVVDILIGLLVYYIFHKWKSADEMFESLYFCTKAVIASINDLVKSLMGSPAGLKLNQPLSNLLGSLVLYYLDIWWSFLSRVRPILELAFIVLIKIGFLGFTFQLAVFADILGIISFHVYCIYIYAARLYEIQAKGLYSLSRLVLGRKRNPEQGKIDSCPYSTEELLIGTISFAVLLFLLPTTLVYYVVFTVMRVGVIAVSGLLNHAIYFMQTLPVYTTVLWVFFPCYTATIVKLTPIIGLSNAEHGSLIAKSINASWLKTMKHCVPDVPAPSQLLPIGQTLWKMATGKLM